MRAVARASGLTLGALQYHYRTRDDLLRALTTFIADQYRAGFAAWSATHNHAHDLHTLLDYMLVEPITTHLQTHRLLPHLWAMAEVEPRVRALLDELYATYLVYIEACLREQGVRHPRADALVILSMLEGTTLFVDPGRRWAAHAPETVAAIRALLAARYGGTKDPRT